MSRACGKGKKKREETHVVPKTGFSESEGGRGGGGEKCDEDCNCSQDNRMIALAPIEKERRKRTRMSWSG